MRLFAEGSGAQVYCVDYKLAPEYQWPGCSGRDAGLGQSFGLKLTPVTIDAGS
jgi:hypothetical protein